MPAGKPSGLAARCVDSEQNGAQVRKLGKGDVYIMSSGGGGGFGDPSQRDREALRRDVREGYVSLEAAWTEYGVRFDPREVS